MIIHYTQSTRGRLPFVTTEAERRRLLTALLGIAGPRALLFCLVDDHLHMTLMGERLTLLVRDLRRAIRRLCPGFELDPPHLKPITDRVYLHSNVGYLLKQPKKHGLTGVHPALYSGSCFLDLVGARLIEGFDRGRLLAQLPRLQGRELYPHVGLEPMAVEAASDDELRRAGAPRVVELAAAALCVGPELKGRTAPIVRARTLAARLLVRLGFTPREIARCVGCDVRHVQRMARSPDDPRAELALRRRLTLELRVLGDARVA